MLIHMHQCVPLTHTCTFPLPPRCCARRSRWLASSWRALRWRQGTERWSFWSARCTQRWWVGVASTCTWVWTQSSCTHCQVVQRRGAGGRWRSWSERCTRHWWVVLLGGWGGSGVGGLYHAGMSSVVWGQGRANAYNARSARGSEALGAPPSAAPSLTGSLGRAGGTRDACRGPRRTQRRTLRAVHGLGSLPPRHRRPYQPTHPALGYPCRGERGSQAWRRQPG